MSHKGVVLKEIHCEGVKDNGPEAALVLNFKHYYCTYKHIDSVKHSQQPLWSLSLEVYNLSTTNVSSFFCNLLLYSWSLSYLDIVRMAKKTQ